MNKRWKTMKKECIQGCLLLPDNALARTHKHKCVFDLCGKENKQNCYYEIVSNWFDAHDDWIFYTKNTKKRIFTKWLGYSAIMFIFKVF